MKCNCDVLVEFKDIEIDLPVLFMCAKCGKLYMCECQKEYYEIINKDYKRKLAKSNNNSKNIIDFVYWYNNAEYKKNICHLCTNTVPKKTYNYSGISKFAKKYFPYISAMVNAYFDGSYLNDSCTDLKVSYSEIEKVKRNIENYIRKRAHYPKIREKEDKYASYYVIVFEVLSENKKYGLGLFCTKDMPHTFVYNKCKNWIEKGFTNGNINMIYCNKANSKYDIKSKKYIYHLEEALLSYKKAKYISEFKFRQYILENYLKYFFIKTNIYSKYEAENYALTLLKKCCKCKLENIEKYSYSKPKNKWVQEEFLYLTIKSIYKKYNVIYQYRPDFLKSNIGGQLSYDIFIKELNIAIEYQGKQHFEPVKFFGGEESYKKTIERDKIKKQLSKKNNIKLIYFKYNETLTKNLIKKKIDNL